MTCYDCHGPSPCRNRACPSCAAETIPAPAPAFAPVWGMPVPEDDLAKRLDEQSRELAAVRARLAELTQMILDTRAEMRRR